jgi:uncharacterized repeat protein (TIGR03803 family)
VSTRFPRFLRGAIVSLTLACVMAGTIAAQVSEQVIFNFNGQNNGYDPQSPLLRDGAGHLYGTTAAGGTKTSSCSAGCGVVFELAPKAGGGWNYRRLYAFTGGSDFSPAGPLVLDAAGNLYGVALGNGIAPGEVFELSGGSGGLWTESVLHTFGGTGDGAFPGKGLIIDAAGNLYGTTAVGGDADQGTVYKLSPNLDGSWTETLLYSFGGQSNDGSGPVVGVISDSAGNLYGTTWNGGTFGWGTVFELSPASGGGWNETVLYSFTGHAELAHPDQGHPGAPLLMDAAGNLYGTTFGNVIHGSGDGTVFELLHNADGSWSQKTLHTFGNAQGTDGVLPGSGALVADKAGNLYGTTQYGGPNSGGIVYKMTRGAAGGWSESIVYAFQAGTTDATGPTYGVTFGKGGGVLFGTTQFGGTFTHGAVYQITP